MIANETTIHQSSNKVDVSNYRQQCCTQQGEKKHTVQSAIKGIIDMKNMKLFN